MVKSYVSIRGEGGEREMLVFRKMLLIYLINDYEQRAQNKMLMKVMSSILPASTVGYRIGRHGLVWK